MATQEEFLNFHTKRIKALDRSISDNNLQIAYHLYYIEQNRAYNYKYANINEYAKKELGLNRKRVWEYTKIAYRFAEPVDQNLEYSIGYQIKDKWKYYNFSQLIQLLKVTDNEIEKLEINSKMSVKEIKKRIKEFLSIKLGETKVRGSPSPFGFHIFDRYGINTLYRLSEDGLKDKDDDLKYKDFRKIKDLVSKDVDYDYYLIKVKKR